MQQANIVFDSIVNELESILLQMQKTMLRQTIPSINLIAIHMLDSLPSQNSLSELIRA